MVPADTRGRSGHTDTLTRPHTPNTPVVGPSPLSALAPPRGRASSPRDMTRDKTDATTTPMATAATCMFAELKDPTCSVRYLLSKFEMKKGTFLPSQRARRKPSRRLLRCSTCL